MRFIALSTCLLVSIILSGQSLLFENYTPEQGLSQHICSGIVQDANGFMWFGTFDGLNRYDGREFKVYSQLNEAGKKLPSNRIICLYFDSTHQLMWIGTSRGPCLYDAVGDSIAPVSGFFPFASALEKLSIIKIISTKPNEYWIRTFNGGILYMDTKRQVLQSFFTSEKEKNNITDIVSHDGKIIVSLLFSLYVLQPDGTTYKSVLLHEGHRFPQINSLASFDNKLWVGTISEGCYYINDPVDKKENIVDTDLVFGGIQAFGKGTDNDLWIVTRGSGIHRYYAATGRMVRAVHNQFDPTTPVSNFGACVFKDRQGIMWFGLSGGIAKYDPLSFQFSHITGATSLNGSLLDKAIYRMYNCKNNSRFIGTQGRGVLQWDKSTNAFTQYPASAIVDVANNVIYDITEDNQGLLWAATCGGLMQLDSRTGKVIYYPEKQVQQKMNKMYALIKLNKTDSLLVSTDEGLRFFSLKDKQWEEKVVEGEDKSSISARLKTYRTAWYFYEDDENVLWICMSGAGLVRYRYLQNDIEQVEPVNTISRGVNYLLADGQHFLVATVNGLIVYDWKLNKVKKHLNVARKGNSNVCHAVQKDNNGCYWISTNKGIVKLNSRFEIVQEFDTGNGLAFSEYNSSCSVKDPDGTLYFGGMGGITYFNPLKLKQNDFSPSPLITEIRVNDEQLAVQKNIGMTTELKFAHDQNFITIKFAVNNFSNERNNLFSYRLKGLTDNWSTAHTDNIAKFTSLPPGNYQFELRSANSDGKWSKEITTLAIVIHSPWWQTWWFLLTSFLLLAGVAVHLVRRRITTIKKDAELKQQLAELEIKGLHAQMNPHFIFNSLNSIKEMILADEKHNASRYLSKFAQLIRTNLEQSRQAFITLKQCIDHLEKYLEMEKIRFEDFRYSIYVDKGLTPDEIPMAPMLIQPLVENAIWHGLRNKAGDKKLLIRFYNKAGQLVCEINDNGTGIIQSRQNKLALHAVHRSLGITNVHERLAVLNEKYGMNCSLTIVDKSELREIEESGTLATLQLTILNQPA